MKKLICFVYIVIICLCLSACSGANNGGTVENNNGVQTEQNVPEGPCVVHLKVNPEFWITVDDYYNVVAFDPANKERQNILANIENLGGNFDEIMKILLVAFAENGYLSSGKEIMFTIYTRYGFDSMPVGEKIENIVKRFSDEKGVTVGLSINSVNLQDEQNADNIGQDVNDNSDVVEYHSNGKRSKRQGTMADGTNYTYIYDENGNIISREFIHSDGSSVYEEYKAGVVVYVIDRSANGEVHERFFNDRGVIVKEEAFTDIGDKIYTEFNRQGIISYTYVVRGNGDFTEETYYNARGKPEKAIQIGENATTTITTFHSNGKRASEHQETNDGVVIDSTYNENGVITYSIYHKDGYTEETFYNRNGNKDTGKTKMTDGTTGRIVYHADGGRETWHITQAGVEVYNLYAADGSVIKCIQDGVVTFGG